MSNLKARADKIIDKIKEEKFIEGRGLGNEISFYVFDYEPNQELYIRDYVKRIKRQLNYEGSNRRVIEFDLYMMLIDITKEKRIFDRIFEMEERQGREATVIGIGSGCNESQNQLGENNNDLSISQVHTSFLFRFLTRFFIDINKLYKHI